MNVVIFDLDGTLRTEKQSEHLHPNDPSIAANWLEWQDHINENGQVIRENSLIYEVVRDFGYNLIVLTSSQHGTEEWMISNNVSIPLSVIERNKDNNKEPIAFKSEIIKGLISNGFKITNWIDNSESMCDFIKTNYPEIKVRLV